MALIDLKLLNKEEFAAIQQQELARKIEVAVDYLNMGEAFYSINDLLISDFEIDFDLSKIKNIAKQIKEEELDFVSH